MPVYNPRLSSIDIEETRRYAGLVASRKTFPENLLAEACQTVRLFIAPKTTWEIYAYDNVFHTIMADSPVLLTSENIISLLDGAVMVAVMAVTIGERLEEAVSEEFNRGSYIKALLLDAAGTNAVEEACSQAAKLIAVRAARLGCVIGKRFSPGYGDLDLSIQADILRLVGAEQIKIGITSSLMLMPRKSITAIIGIYPCELSVKMPVLEKSGCDFCCLPYCSAKKEELTVGK